MQTRNYQTDGCIPGCCDWSNQKPKPASQIYCWDDM